MKFSRTIDELKRISREMKGQGVTVQKLDEAIGELSNHQENIEKIEANIDAIREEVVAPLQKELEQNRVAGRFSIFGFWIGAAGLLVSIFTILVSNQQKLISFWEPPVKTTTLNGHDCTHDLCLALDKRLRLLSEQLLFPDVVAPEPNEIFIESNKRIPIALGGSDETTIFAELWVIADYPPGGGPRAALRIYRGNKLLSKTVLEHSFVQVDGTKELREWVDNDSIAVAEGDSFEIKKTTFLVEKVFSKAPLGRLVGDESDGLVISVGK
jgi:DNA-binding transcriptional MerR regulator